MTGYQSKKAAAQAKVEGPVHVVCQCDKCKAQPAQEPASVTYKEVQDSMNSLEKGNLHQQAIAEELGQRKLYTTPPQRTWVGLTSQERDAKRWRFLMENSYDSQSVTQFHVWEHSWEPHSKTSEPTEWKQRVRGIALIDFIDRAIEAKLKEKNT